MLATMASATRVPAAPRRRRVYVGTFTLTPESAGDFGGRSQFSHGIYCFDFDPANGVAGPISLAAATGSPAHLVAHPNGRFLYACNGQGTTRDGQNLITAFAIDGALLRTLNSVTCGGRGPSLGVVDRGGRNLLTVNYASSSTVCLRLNPDGSLGGRSALIGNPPSPPGAQPSDSPPPPSPGPAAGPDADPLARRPPPLPGVYRTKPHAIVLSESQRFAVAAEIDADRCAVYRFDAMRGSLQLHQYAASEIGAGPRHLAFHPSYRYLYTADEAGSSISAWRWDEDLGHLQAVQRMPTAPESVRARNHPSDVRVHPGGEFVYVANRGHGSIAGFRIDPRNGSLAPLAEVPLDAKSSWSLQIDPGGRWLIACTQDPDAVRIYAIDSGSGQLRPTGQVLETILPTCLTLV